MARSAIAVLVCAAAAWVGCGEDERSAAGKPVQSESPGAPVQPVVVTDGDVPRSGSASERFTHRASMVCLGARGRSLPLAFAVTTHLAQLKPPPQRKRSFRQMVAVYVQLAGVHQDAAQAKRKRSSAALESLERAAAQSARRAGLPVCAPRG